MNNQDISLQAHLKSLACGDSDYWSFRRKAVREHSHGYFQYPAMMVPQMQRSLIEAAQKHQSGIEWIFDPFAGSGTILTEALMLGLNFAGYDINPLAILSCRAKSGPFRSRELKTRYSILLDTLQKDKSIKIEAEFPGLEKWFNRQVYLEISRINRAIRSEDVQWVRRFFWIALAETIRLSSNSRTSTFKLHIRSKKDILERNISPISLFKEILKNNIKRIHSQENILRQKGYIEKGRYIGKIDVRLKNAASIPVCSSQGKYDLLVTSPPYGDNVTTVPYGQYSYLPLQWIDFKDIARNADKRCLITTHAIDIQSLGGSRKLVNKWEQELSDLSLAFGNFIKSLKGDERAKKVTAFCRDLYRCLKPILSSLKPNSYMFWTLGNRRVAGKVVPLDNILRDFLESSGSVFVDKIDRIIPSKRMAVKNSIADTMKSETVLIMRKAGDNGKKQKN
ncbi:MAG: site-specific DNA-methyltransferase [Deltaproteobacteria bacterium]|nr:site-specific DNA-methyltransferase [Deltaproteobacteria bacterium]